MGIGNVTTEELIYDESGRLLTDGTWEYKPPCSKTIPKVSQFDLNCGFFSMVCTGLQSNLISWCEA